MIEIAYGTGIISINSIGEELFSRRYFADCFNCDFCADMCCSYGCPVDITERERIMSVRHLLEGHLPFSPSGWFGDSAELSPEFPSGQIVRTNVYNGKCVFYNRWARGCLLHSLALANGIEPHRLKPMICFLFPLTVEAGHLYVSEFLDELPCRDKGISIMEAQEGELKYYLGDEFVIRLKTLRQYK